MQSLPIHRKWLLCLVVFVIIFGFTTPVLADYLGPNRTVTESVSACKIVLKECQFVPAKGDYRYKTSESWSCSIESKPWQEYSSNSRPCNSGNTGYEYWEREDSSEDTIVTYPPATISGSLQNCSLQNGWCGVTTPQLALSANEPVAGYGIVLIEGLLNGTSFACPNATCSVPLNEGDNNLSYWALSSWGDSSTMDTFTARVDTVSPDVSLDISGANGANGWYVSPTIVTATGADATSGLASAVLSVNGGARQPSVTLNDGVYDIVVTAADLAGNVSNSSATISVDTTTPSVNVSVSRTVGKNGWYRSNIQVSALASDSTSGISSLQVSADGGVYQNYTSAVPFTDGLHTIQFKAIDAAGNTTETPIQLLYVDTVPPAIKLPASWSLGKTVKYDVQDAGSGLAALRLVIEDEDERYAKVAWTETVSGSMYSEDIHWDGQFKDKTAAPPGTYLVWIKASDQAGNENIRLGKVIVPEPNVFLSLVQPDDAVAEFPAETPVPPEELSDTNDSSSSTASSNLDFGGSATESIEVTTHSLLLTTGTSGSIPSTSSEILWGAAAAAVAGSATAFVLAEKRKREDAIAEQQALEKAEEERRKKKKARKLVKMEAQRQQEQMWEDARQEAWNPAHANLKVARTEAEEGVAIALKNLAPSLYNIIAKRDQRTDIKDVLVEQEVNAHNAKPQGWKTAEERRQAEELQAGLAAYYAAMRQGEKEAPQPEPNWWEKTKSFVDKNVIQPVNTSVYQPYIKPAIEIREEMRASYMSWLDKNINQPYIQPAIERNKQFIENEFEWINDNIYEPHIQPVLERNKQFIASEFSWMNENIYQPYIQPAIERNKQFIANEFGWMSDNIYQPYIQPLAAQANEKFYQPYVKPLLDKSIEVVAESISWVDENLYQPILEPVVSDINQYIYQPLARKITNWWDKYGEWVHSALDTAGFVPGLGDIADGLNGLVYLAEGRYAEASVSALAMIPLLGDLGKVSKLGLEIGEEIVEETAEKVAKEAVEELGEQAAKETAEEVTETALKETSEELVEQTAKETLEASTQKSLREASEALVTKATKESIENLEDKASKEISEKITKQSLNGVVAKAEKDVTSVISAVPTKQVSKVVVEETVEESAEQASKVSAEFIDSLREEYGDEALDVIIKYDDKGIALIQQYGDEAIDFVKHAEKQGVNPADVLDDPPLPGQTLEGWLLKIDNPENPVNMPLRLGQTDAEIGQLRKECVQNAESRLFSIGYGRDAKIPFDKMGNHFDEYPMAFVSVPAEKWSKYEDTGAFGDFWKANRHIIEWGMEEKKIFVLNMPYDVVTDLDPRYSRRFSLAEVNVIEAPTSGYTMKRHGDYAVFVPNEFVDTYNDLLPPEIRLS